MNFIFTLRKIGPAKTGAAGPFSSALLHKVYVNFALYFNALVVKFLTVL